jgi:hypothetical protein
MEASDLVVRAVCSCAEIDQIRYLCHWVVHNKSWSKEAADGKETKANAGDGFMNGDSFLETQSIAVKALVEHQCASHADVGQKTSWIETHAAVLALLEDAEPVDHASDVQPHAVTAND